MAIGIKRHADAWLKGHEALVNDWLAQARAAAAKEQSAG